MIIIFDGLDNTGKDTQIKILQQYLIDKPTHILHYMNIPNISNKLSRTVLEQQYIDSFLLIRESIFKRHLIFNRFMYSENVYATKYRNYDGDYIFNIEKNNSDLFNNIFLIIFIDSYSNLISRDDGMSLSVKKDDKIYEINKFKDTFNQSKLTNKVLIDIHNKSIKQVSKEILFFLKLGINK